MIETKSSSMVGNDVGLMVGIVGDIDGNKEGEDVTSVGESEVVDVELMANIGSIEW